MKIIFATSKRKDGNMGSMLNLWAREAIKNRVRFLKKLGIPPANAVCGEQVHGAKTACVEKIPAQKFFPKTDALVTNKPSIFLFVLTADCFPVFLFDEKIPAIGIAHAGWRSIVRGLIPNTIGALKKYYKVKPRELKAIIGPGIRKCHFEIKEDALPHFKKYRRFISQKKNKIFIDLPGIIKQQLAESGVPLKNIADRNECTYHLEKRYFSYRRNKNEYPKNTKGLKEMLSVIGIRDSKYSGK